MLFRTNTFFIVIYQTVNSERSREKCEKLFWTAQFIHFA